MNTCRTGRRRKSRSRASSVASQTYSPTEVQRIIQALQSEEDPFVSDIANRGNSYRSRQALQGLNRNPLLDRHVMFFHFSFNTCSALARDIVLHAMQFTGIFPPFQKLEVIHTCRHALKAPVQQL